MSSGAWAFSPRMQNPTWRFSSGSAAVTNPVRCQVDSIVAHFWTLIEPLEPGKSVKCETTVPLAGVSETTIRGMVKSKIVLR